ncbi:MAG TPA: hypothetical protein P5164_10235 [Thermoanaerobaculia bacterium]|nr:hypothetical protein [Thermoanaerobaculia bacterium]
MAELVWQLRKGPDGAPYAFAAFNRAEKRTNFFDGAEPLRAFLIKHGVAADDAVALAARVEGGETVSVTLPK